MNLNVYVKKSQSNRRGWKTPVKIKCLEERKARYRSEKVTKEAGKKLNLVKAEREGFVELFLAVCGLRNPPRDLWRYQEYLVMVRRLFCTLEAGNHVNQFYN